MHATGNQESSWKRVSEVVAGLVVILLVLLSAFTLPAVNSGPNDVSIALAGPGGPQLGAMLEQQEPGAFDFTTVSNPDAARELILDREVYGAFIVDQSGTSVLVASAASPAVANALRGIAAQIGQAQGATIPVEDIRPLPDDDQNGLGLAAGALPLAVGGILGAIAIHTALGGQRQQAVAAISFAVVSGFALIALLQFGLGSLDGNYVLTSLAAILGLSTTTWAVLGIRTLFGQVGALLGAIVIVLLGNPLSGLNSAPEMLPGGWGTFGQLLPPGALGSLIRSVAFFDGAGATTPTLVLSTWLIGGLALFGIATYRRPRHAKRTASFGSSTTPEPAR